MKEERTCARCGRSRQVKASRATSDFCGDCGDASTGSRCERCGIPRRGTTGHPTMCSHCAKDGSDISFKGTWKRRGLVMVPVPDEPESTAPACMDCGTQLQNSKSKRCRPCFDASNAPTKTECIDCGKPIDRKATRCYPCNTKARRTRQWDWDATATRFAHRRHVAGHRDPWTVEGEREYWWLWKQKKRKEVA